MEIERSQMEKELLETWKRELEDTPVYKDLPRLAGRITVEGQFSKPPTGLKNSIVEIQKEQTVRSFLLNEGKKIGQDAKAVEPFILILEKNWYFHVDNSICLIAEEKWKEFNIPDRLVQALLSAAKEAKVVQKEHELSLEKQIQRKSITSFRLSASIEGSKVNFRNLEKIDKIEDVKFEVEGEDKEETKEEMNHRLLRDIKRVVLEVATRLESKSQLNKINNAFDVLLEKEKQGDLQYVMEYLFTEVIGKESKTAKVFKAIHQNIIFIAVFQIKTKIKMLSMTRDVREKEGWRINVLFNNNVVVVSHRRREQSLANAPEDEQYWFEWELRMLFDKDLNDLESSQLKITDVGFHEKIKDSKRQEINKALSCGNLIVS